MRNPRLVALLAAAAAVFVVALVVFISAVAG